MARFYTIAALAFGFSAAACGQATPARDPSALISQAHRLDLDGRQDAAIELYRQALERAPDSFDAQYGLARALDLAGRYEDARDHFTRALALAPEGSADQTQRMLGISWTFVGRVDEAARCFRAVFDRRLAAGQFASAAEVANELARVYLESGDEDRAETWYRTGYETAHREANPSASQVDLAEMRWAHAQARLAARRGQRAEAQRLEARVKALLDKGGNDSQRSQYPYLVGYDAFHLGDTAAAVAHLEQADQKDPFILFLLAEAHERLGDADRAREYYAKVLASSSHAIAAAFARPVARQKLGK